LVAILIAIIFHECAHGLMAKWNGDLTAQYARRITLNPIRHFDILGFTMLALVGFGYAKPVPVNIENFKNKRKGVILVSLAGVKINLILALFSALLFVIVERFGSIRLSGLTYPNGNMIDPVNSMFAVLAGAVRGMNANSIPMNNAADAFTLVFGLFFYISLRINIMLVLFNLLPLFPLDGHRLLEAMLGSYNKLVKFLRDWGTAILLGLIGLNLLFMLINVWVPGILNFSPLAALMHFGGGAIQQSFLNLFRTMFGVRRIWVF